MTVQTFNPENVLVSQKKDGTLHKEFTDIIMKDVAQNSLVMQLGQYQEMDGQQEKTVYVQTDGISAYWVNETEKIKSHPIWVRGLKFSRVTVNKCSFRRTPYGCVD